MIVHVVLGLENRLELPNSRLEVDPALALGSGDLVGGNTRLDQPALDGVDGVLIGSEELNNLILGIVLAIVGRRRIGTVFVLEKQYSCIIWKMKFDLHIKQVVHTIVDVLLLQGNSNRNLGIGVGSLTLDPATRGHIALLVDCMGAGGNGDGPGEKAVEEDKADLHPG